MEPPDQTIGLTVLAKFSCSQQTEAVACVQDKSHDQTVVVAVPSGRFLLSNS